MSLWDWFNRTIDRILGFDTGEPARSQVPVTQSPQQLPDPVHQISTKHIEEIGKLQVQLNAARYENTQLKEKIDGYEKQLARWREQADANYITREQVYADLAKELDLLPRTKTPPTGLEYQSHSGHGYVQPVTLHSVVMSFLEAKEMLKRDRQQLDLMANDIEHRTQALIKMAADRKIAG